MSKKLAMAPMAPMGARKKAARGSILNWATPKGREKAKVIWLDVWAAITLKARPRPSKEPMPAQRAATAAAFAGCLWKAMAPIPPKQNMPI